MSAPEGTLATCPCFDMDGYRVCVEIRLSPRNVRSIETRKPVSASEAKAFLDELQKKAMQPVLNALARIIQNET